MFHRYSNLIPRRRLVTIGVILYASAGFISLTHIFRDQIVHVSSRILIEKLSFDSPTQQSNLKNFVEVADVYGDEKFEEFGYCVSTNSNGTFVVVSSPLGNGNLWLYKKDGNQYKELNIDWSGSDYGRSSAIDPMNRVVVVGAPSHDKKGSVYLYQISNDNVKKSTMFSGKNNYDQFGYSVAISNDGYVPPPPEDNDDDDDCDDDINDDRYQPPDPITPPDDDCNDDINSDNYRPPGGGGGDDDCNDDINNDNYQPPGGGGGNDDCNDDINNDNYQPPGGGGGVDDCNDDINEDGYQPPRTKEERAFYGRSIGSNKYKMDNSAIRSQREAVSDDEKTNVEDDDFKKKTFVVVGAPAQNQNQLPYVRVYFSLGDTWDDVGANWRQKGPDITSQRQGVGFGKSVAVEQDGKYIIVGTPDSPDTEAIVYFWDIDYVSWNPLPDTIKFGGTESYSKCGHAVDITQVRSNPDDPSVPTIVVVVGCDYFKTVRAYYLSSDGRSFKQYGGDITDATNGFGRSVSISADANSLVVGNPDEGKTGDVSRGKATLYKYVGGDWKERVTYPGLASGGAAGSSVSIAADGDSFVVGSPEANKGNLPKVGMITFFRNQTGFV